MKKIITALQNEMVNKKLSQYENVKVMANDIQYQEGILEALEIDSNIDFIIFSELLPGEMKMEELIEAIRKKNEAIKMIVILESKKEELENYLLGKGKIVIFYNNEITIEQLMKVIEEKSNQELLEQELLEIKKIIHKENPDLLSKKEFEEEEPYPNHFLTKEQKEEFEQEIEEEFQKTTVIQKLYHFIHPKEKNKIAQIIFVMGLRGCGKTVFTINLAQQFKNKKVLIVELNSKNQDIAFLKNKKRKEGNLPNNNGPAPIDIMPITKQIHLFSQSNNMGNEIEIVKEMKKWKENYDVIVIDMESEMKDYFSVLLEEIDHIIFLTEANILQIKKSKMYLEEMRNQYKIEKEKISILFHKITEASLSFNILKNTLKEYNFLGKVNNIENCNLLINHNMKSTFLKKKIRRQYQKIGNEILKNKNTKEYYLTKINDNGM